MEEKLTDFQKSRVNFARFNQDSQELKDTLILLRLRHVLGKHTKRASYFLGRVPELKKQEFELPTQKR